MTLEPYYDSERSLYVIPGPVLLEIIATAQRDEREACLELIAEHVRMFDAMAVIDAIKARGKE